MPEDSLVSKQGFRRKVQDLEKSLASSVDTKKIDLETAHFFAHRTYGRQLFIPKGCTVTGKIHRYSCINVILKGDITVNTEQGKRRVKAPHAFVSPPGTKRACYVHADTLWMTLHHTEQTEPEKAEQELVTESYYAFENEPPPQFPPGGLTEVEEQTLKHLLEKKRLAIR